MPSPRPFSWASVQIITRSQQVLWPGKPYSDASARKGFRNRRADAISREDSQSLIAWFKTIKLIIAYPMSTGRNFDEVLRVIESLRLTAYHSVATPVNRQPGEEVIIVPPLSDEEARKKFPGGWTAPRPYLRIVPQPDRLKSGGSPVTPDTRPCNRRAGPPRSTVPRAGVALRRLSRVSTALIRAVTLPSRENRSLQILGALDDRSLKNLGFHRSEIPSIVMGPPGRQDPSGGDDHRHHPRPQT